MKYPITLLLLLMTYNISSAQISIEELTLSNGLTVWLSHDKSEPKVYGTVIVKAGAKHSPNTGIAHYFEHIMFKGTDKIGTTDYSKEKPILDEIASQYSLLTSAKSTEERSVIQKRINELNIEASQYAIPNDFNNLITRYGGSGLNAGTSYDYTTFFNTFTPEYLEHWCVLNSERLIHPVFRLFQSELETVYEEKNMYSDNMATEPTKRIFERVAAPHPYQYPIIGSTEALKNPDLKAMESFFDTYYRAGNMALILVGDFKREGLEDLLERTFGRVASGNAPQESLPQPKRFVGHERMDVKLPIPVVTGSAYIWQTVPNGHPDQIPLAIIQELLSNAGKTGLLDKLTIDGKVMVSGALNTSLNDLGVFGFYVAPKILHSNNLARRSALREIEKIKKGEFTDSQLKRVKLSVQQAYIQQIEEPEKRSKLLGNLYAQGENWTSLQKDLEHLKNITKVEVVRIANLYLTNNFLDIRKKTGKYPKEKLQKPPYEAVSAPNRGAVSELARHLESLSTPELCIRSLDFDKDVERRTLSENGFVRLFKNDNPLNDLFTLDLLYYRQPEKHPRQEQLDLYLDLVGGGGMSAHSLNSQLQDLGASITYESKKSFFLIRLTGFDNHFDESLDLLAKFLFDVNVEEKQMKKLREAKSISDKALKKDPAGLSRHLLELARYGDSAPFRASLSLKELKKTKASDLVSDFNTLLQSELDIHYTGTLHIDSIADKVAVALRANSINTKGEGYSYNPSIVPANTRVLFTHDSSATQAIIRIYIPLGILNDDDKAALRLYGAYLGGGMSSLLFQEVREYRSMAYGVSGTTDLPPASIKEASSDCVIFLSTQSDKVTDAINLVAELIQRAPDDSARYESAKQTILSNARTYYPSLRMRSRNITSMERQGYKKDIALLFQEEVERLNQKDIRQAHERCVKGKPLTITIVGNKNRINLDELKKKYTVVSVPVSDLLN